MIRVFAGLSLGCYTVGKGKVTRVVNTLWLSQSDKIRDFVLPDAGTLMATSAQLAWLIINQMQMASLCIEAYDRVTFYFYYEIIEPRPRFEPTKLTEISQTLWPQHYTYAIYLYFQDSTAHCVYWLEPQPIPARQPTVDLGQATQGAKNNDLCSLGRQLDRYN